MKKMKKEKILVKIQLLEEALEKSRAETKKARRRYQKAKRKKEAIQAVLAKKRAALIPKPKPETAPEESKVSWETPGYSGTSSLCLIKGIGPKTEKLLHEAGIHSFEMLGTFTPEQLMQILSDGGPHFCHYDPTTWLIQARELARQANNMDSDMAASPSEPSEKEKK